jgi:hypothetical protein
MLQHSTRTRGPRTSLRALSACVVAVLALSLCTSQAFAEDKPAATTETATVSGEVIVILASEGEGGIDPSLEKIKALKQPPFNAFKSMKVLSRTAVKLQTTEATTVDLPNGRRLQLTLMQRMPDGRAKVQVSINKPDQKDYLPLLQVIAKAGEPFFVAGQKYQGGTLVIGVRVGEPPATK